MSLLQIEWMKIRRYRTFWIMSGLFALLLLLWNLMVSNGSMKMGDGGVDVLSRAYTFPGVWANVGFWVKFFMGMFSIVIITLTTNEFSYRTNRQNIIDGWERLQFYHAKWLLILALSLGVTMFAGVLSLVFGLINTGSFAGVADGSIALLYIFVLALNYFGGAFFLSLLLKRSGLSTLIFLLYLYVGEVIIQKLLNWKLDSDPGDFLPLQASSELLPFPLIRTLQDAAGMGSNTGPMVYLGVALIWTVLFYVLGRRKLLRADW